MKKRLLLLGLFFSVFAFSQVGINNPSPKATLDVTAKNLNGSTAEGIIAPRMTGDQVKSADAMYGADQVGAMVYVTSAVGTPSAKTINITEPSYYYFDGTVWKKVISQSQSFFIPTVVSSGTGNSDINMADASGFNKWSFSPNVNDGNFSTTTNAYTVTKPGFYQMSLQGLVEPSTNNNSFAWTLSYTINSVVELYTYSTFRNIMPGNQYNQGGIVVLFLPVGSQISFGGVPCSTCSGTSYIARSRSFSITYLGT